MPATVLVVEYEPRYLDRIRHAFAGRPISALIAKDGDEALQLLSQRPQAIVISWILPKLSGADLIRAIRARPEGAEVPILLTVSGYNGRDPRADAHRVGATALLAKPFQESDFLAQVASLLGIDADALTQLERELGDFSIDAPPEKHSAVSHQMAPHEGDKLTSSEIFGDMLGDDESEVSHPTPPPAAARSKPEDEIDELLSQTMVNLRRNRRETSSGNVPTPSEIDRLVEDTLSGLGRRKKQPVPPSPQEPTSTPESAPSDSSAEISIAPLDPAEETISARPGAKFGQFVLREKIATGGMAEIWKAQMHGVEGFEKLVAIKRILPHLSADQEFVDMFINEAKIAARLSHPNIVHIYDLGRASGSYYIAMELVDGHDLKSILRKAAERHHPMSTDLACFIASKIGAALDYAHRKEEGLVHRDVSPQNVLISWEGDIKLCDFGIAKATSKVSHTLIGALKGKLQYMSPEQASGKTIDRRSDVFSLGAVLFEMLTGRKLFSGENEISVLEQVREARVETPSRINDEVSPEIDRIVLKALAREREGRHGSAGEMVRELDQVLYAMRPTPTAADVAVWLNHLWSEDPAKPAVVEPVRPEPEVDARVITIAVPPPPPDPAAERTAARRERSAQVAHATMERHAPFAAPQQKKPGGRRGLMIAAAIVLVALAAAGGFAVLRSRSATPAESEPAIARVDPAPPGATSDRPAEPAPLSPELPPAETATILEDDTAADIPLSGAMVDEEVNRRLEAERRRLEQLRARQLAESAPAPRRKAAQPPPATSREAELPPEGEAPSAKSAVEAGPEDEPAPSAPGPTPVRAETIAQPVSQPPVTQTAPPPSRAGDYVSPGTPGLTDAVLVNLRRVSYPQMAKMRRIEGIVVLQALVSETGKVLEVKVLRGPGSGLDEAAMDAVRGGTFRPGMRNGVAVKSHKTLTVPFKL